MDALGKSTLGAQNIAFSPASENRNGNHRKSGKETQRSEHSYFKIRSCTVRTDLRNKASSADFVLNFKIRSNSARSDLKNKSARFSGKRHININNFVRWLPRWGGGVSRPVAQGQMFMCFVQNSRNMNIFVQVPLHTKWLPNRTLLFSNYFR